MDRRTLLGALGLALAAPLGSALAAEPPKYTRPGRVYNQNGAYEGRMDSSGRMYDQSGRYVGREDSSGRRYDASGRYQGRTDADGRRYGTPALTRRREPPDRPIPGPLAPRRQPLRQLRTLSGQDPLTAAHLPKTHAPRKTAIQ